MPQLYSSAAFFTKPAAAQSKEASLNEAPISFLLCTNEQLSFCGGILVSWGTWWRLVSLNLWFLHFEE
ncbi:uncharacterized protein [Medicago truncatula]|uniref:uncharacterized protein n=1 Tax=Medicago truncatula TaxID=3880 RepID=UPI000D2F19CB|nr:uncharacterized protein LOC112416770 [Medicago truncatula]